MPGTFSSQEQPGKPPSDAVILFDGTDLSKWEADTGTGIPAKWVIKNGAMECVPGSGQVRTKEKFGDCQLHVEWAAPINVQGVSQGRGNSGVFLLGLIEVQVLDNYNNPSYADGMAAAVYGQDPPMANALRAPGEFQTYDIVFRGPIYDANGKEADPGYVTVFENGVLVQDHAMIEGPTGNMIRTKPTHFPEAGPLKLQDHNNPVRYRNIWYRPLAPRKIESPSDSYLTLEATTAKRKEIADGIRQNAAKAENPANPVPQLLLLAESLEYDNDAAIAGKVQQMVSQFVNDLVALPPDQIAAKRDDARRLRDALRFLARFKVISDTLEPKVKLEKFITEHNWDTRRGGRG